ncbi:flagellar biosynthetic protein FliQ [Alkalispirochaeta sphaeroplastigenens]|uniref:Flagellar biosynthetic protein FliQ n=1 Tax=Alkalispirochaeta sphaeroplastigenens TaxID=1187066 RepID=A0A2S4JYW5_9SPIO|nr:MULTISPECIES: flagellar biosynthesis protein FliQ [Alkalispirochaeta]POR04710.1 flagellar biosynthetic protein FliQ [Alkalispirochaeta sphaeroplastigenens]
MSLGQAVTIFRSGIFQLLIVSSPILLIAMVTGLIISILQATTSIQEQTLTFVPKIAAILLALIYFGPWIMQMLMQYTLMLLNQIGSM